MLLTLLLPPTLPLPRLSCRADSLLLTSEAWEGGDSADSVLLTSLGAGDILPAVLESGVGSRSCVKENPFCKGNSLLKGGKEEEEESGRDTESHLEALDAGLATIPESSEAARLRASPPGFSVVSSGTGARLSSRHSSSDSGGAGGNEGGGDGGSASSGSNLRRVGTGGGLEDPAPPVPTLPPALLVTTVSECLSVAEAPLRVLWRAASASGRSEVRAVTVEEEVVVVEVVGLPIDDSSDELLYS